jgi:hypothetical protein
MRLRLRIPPQIHQTWITCTTVDSTDNQNVPRSFSFSHAIVEWSGQANGAVRRYEKTLLWRATSDLQDLNINSDCYYNYYQFHIEKDFTSAASS